MPQSHLQGLLPDSLVHSAIFSFVVTDLSGNYIFVNNLFKERFGFLTDDFIGLPFASTIHPDDVPKCMEAAGSCIANPGTTVTVQVRKPDLHTRTFYWTQWEFSLLRDHDRQPLGITCVGYDFTEAELAIRQAREFRKRMDALMDTLTDGYYVLNRDWEFVKINAVAEKILDAPRSRLLGRSLWDVFPDVPAYNYPAMFRKAMQDHVTVNFEDYRPDLQRWYSAVVYPSAEGLAVFFKDITAQRLAQDELGVSENKLRAILESTTDSHLLLDLRFRIISFNHAAEVYFGVLSGLVMKEGDDFGLFVPPGVAERLQTHHQEALRGVNVTVEMQLGTAEGLQWHQLKWFPARDAEGRLIGVAVNICNIDAQKQGQERLRQSQYMLNAIYNSTAEASTFISPEGKMLYFNKKSADMMEALFGRRPAIGDDMMDYVVPAIKDEVGRYFNRALQGETVQSEQQNEGRWYRFSYFPVYDEAQKLVGVADIVEDITDRKQAELKIMEQNKALREIAWQQSHELRRPLANIMGVYNLFKDSPDMPAPEKDRLFAYLFESSRQLDEVIHRIVRKTDEAEQTAPAPPPDGTRPG